MSGLALTAIVIIVLFFGFMFYQSYQFDKAEKLKTKKNRAKLSINSAEPAWNHQIVEDFNGPLFVQPRIEKRHPEVKFRQDELEMLIKYRTHEGDKMERRVTVYGLGQFRNRHYVVGYCHLRNAMRTFDVRKFKNSIDLKTGEMITKPMAYILAFNPDITDLTDEFEALEQERLGISDF